MNPKIEKISVNTMCAFPDNPADENIALARKINEIIEVVNLLSGKEEK